MRTQSSFSPLLPRPLHSELPADEALPHLHQHKCKPESPSSSYLRRLQPFSTYTPTAKTWSLHLYVKTQVCSCSPESHSLSQATFPAAPLRQTVGAVCAMIWLLCLQHLTPSYSLSHSLHWTKCMVWNFPCPYKVIKHQIFSLFRDAGEWGDVQWCCPEMESALRRGFLASPMTSLMEAVSCSLTPPTSLPLSYSTLFQMLLKCFCLFIYSLFFVSFT